jgi:hypothetical protein
MTAEAFGLPKTMMSLVGRILVSEKSRHSEAQV